MNRNTHADYIDIKFDRPLFIAVILLLGFGVVMVYSASAVRAAQEQNDPTFFLYRQAVYGIIGLVAMLIGSKINYHFYGKIVYPFLGLSIAGLILCHTPLGRTLNGAARWVSLGPITVQPSEGIKVALVIWLSYSLAKKSERIKTFSVGFLPHLIIPGIIILLCLLQPDFGTSVVLATVTFGLLFVAGAKLGYMMLACIATAPFVYYLVTGSEYRLNRILAFLDPISNRYDYGYQLTQSLFGFGSGGIFGAGLGDGLQKFFFLPEAHNDFIAAIIAEELGLIGIWAIILVFIVIFARGITISMRAESEFGTYIAFGLTMMLGVQVLANLGVAMGLLPTKGLNLPFVSSGGTALVMSLYSIGILLNISKPCFEQTPKPDLQSAGGNKRRSSIQAKGKES